MRSGRSTGVDARGADNYGVCPLRHGDVLPVSVQGECRSPLPALAPAYRERQADLWMGRRDLRRMNAPSLFA
jgi:hypothetical protein